MEYGLRVANAQPPESDVVLLSSLKIIPFFTCFCPGFFLGTVCWDIPVSKLKTTI